MKLKSLQIESFHHLENLDFDFTYPDGHEFAGKPLNKICIIGQSATGKTSLLELIKNNIESLAKVEYSNEKKEYYNHNFRFDGIIEYQINNENLIVEKNKIIKNLLELNPFTIGSYMVSPLVQENLKLLYFSSDIISKEVINLFNQNPLDLINILNDKNQKVKVNIDNNNYIHEFTQTINTDTWFSILFKTLEYRKNFYQMASELINKGAIGDLQKLNDKYSHWAKNNENPLEKFAKYFDPVLEKLNLKIDLVNTEYSIPIKSMIKDEVIPIASLSTGTKGLLLSMFPLFELNTNESIILLDEPERSLFPDLQIDLINLYQAIAPNAQLIVATHSPFIAAAFEPEERFILYFDNDGKVVLRRGISPIGDDPNDILYNDFKVDYYNEFGKEAYKRYCNLKLKIASETEEKKKNKLFMEMVELGDKYNF